MVWKYKHFVAYFYKSLCLKGYLTLKTDFNSPLSNQFENVADAYFS